MSSETPRYSSRVLELFAELPGAGALPAGRGEIVAGEALALDRGAWVRFEARLHGGHFQDCRFLAWGCPHTLAAAALAAAAIRSHPELRPAEIDAARLARELSAPADKMGRLLVVEDALRALFAAGGRVQ